MTMVKSRSIKLSVSIQRVQKKSMHCVHILHFPDAAKLMKCPKSTEAQINWFNKLLKFCDENGDGKLSEAEAKAGFGAFDLWKETMGKVFEKLKDDQGEVSNEGELICTMI